jgi:hypothetical protein
VSLLISFAAFTQQREEIEKQLEVYGHVEVSDIGARKGVRAVSFSVDVPGQGEPTIAKFEYTEQFHRVREGWFRDEYYFEYRPKQPPGRKAHHLHDPWGFHQHCSEDGRIRADHYVDIERLLQATHEGFAYLYARDRPVECLNLIRLKASRAK